MRSFLLVKRETAEAGQLGKKKLRFPECGINSE